MLSRAETTPGKNTNNTMIMRLATETGRGWLGLMPIS